MKATKKMFVLNLFLAAMGSVALADGNTSTVTCVGDRSTEPGLNRQRVAISMKFDESEESANLEEYRVFERNVCGRYFVLQSILQNREESKVEPFCGTKVVDTSLGRLQLNVLGGATAQLYKGGAPELMHCYQGEIENVEEFLNNEL